MRNLDGGLEHIACIAESVIPSFQSTFDWGIRILFLLLKLNWRLLKLLLNFRQDIGK